MVEMTGEGPGTRPTKKPMKDPRMMGQNERFHSTSVGQSSRKRTFWSCIFPTGSSAVTSTSDMPKSPMATGRKSIPLGQEGLFEGVAHIPGHGLHADRSEGEPQGDHHQRFDKVPPVSRDMITSPTRATARYSAGPNLRAAIASVGARKLRPIRLIVPAMNEPMAATARRPGATPAGHLVPFDHRDDGSGLPGDVEQNGGRRAAVHGSK